MENVTRALIMAFSMILFVIGFSYAMHLINSLMTTSEVLLDTVSTTNYYDNIEVTGQVDGREVTVDAIVSTLYRYYKENYAVRIYDGTNLVQVFDISLEDKVRRAAAYSKTTATTNAERELNALKKSDYNKSDKSVYLFQAPWIGSTDENTRARIDFFLNGTKGYINNTLVDYTKDDGFLKKYQNDTFIETFVEYAYTGETISTANGLETITGNTQENSKIIINYYKK